MRGQADKLIPYRDLPLLQGAGIINAHPRAVWPPSVVSNSLQAHVCSVLRHGRHRLSRASGSELSLASLQDDWCFQHVPFKKWAGEKAC